MRLVLVLILVYAIGPIATQLITSDSKSEIFNVCGDDSMRHSVRFLMVHFYGNSHWIGSFLTRDWPQLKEAPLSITLDAPANVEVISNVKNRVRARNGNRTFDITIFDSSYANNTIGLKVSFVPNVFPNVVAMKFFNLDVCADPVQTTSHGGPKYRLSELRQMRILQCGKRVLEHEQLITIGFAARDGDWPWHSAIYHVDRAALEQAYKCGGTLITSNAILTAAHCLYDGDGPIIAERVIVHVGKYNLALAGQNTQQFQAHRIIVHPDYTPARLLDDIGIIRLATEARFTAYVKPICLWDVNRKALTEVINRRGVVVGWGFDERDKIAKKLTQASMPVVSATDCLTSNPSFFGSLITDKTFCAGFRNGTSTCNGDSGGGMYFEDGEFYRLRGIVSVAKSRSSLGNFCDPKEYVVFTDAAQYLDWIRENTI